MSSCAGCGHLWIKLMQDLMIRNQLQKTELQEWQVHKHFESYSVFRTKTGINRWKAKGPKRCCEARDRGK